MRTRALAFVIVGIIGCLAIPAHADPRADIAAKARSAMASYDSMDYDAARRQLNQALAIAKKAKLDHDPVVARVYLDLGIAQLAGSDQEAARGSFLSAAQIDPKITIDSGYKTTELVKMLEEAKAAARAAVTETVTGDLEGTGDCSGVRGLQHTVIESGRLGAAQPIEALVSSDLAPAKVVVMYRAEGAIDFTEVKLTRQGTCRYTGAIPASAMHGNLVHYYVAAYDANNKALAAKGSSGSPNIIEIGGAGRVAARETEDPINGSSGHKTGGGGTSASTSVSSTAPDRDDGSTVELAVNIGTGFGYVTGKTEAGNDVQTCCIGTSLLVVTPELDYTPSRQLRIGVAVRIGLPIGANIDGHSTSAPAGFLRIHYGLSSDGDGLQLMGETGVGVLRNTIKINASLDMPGMDTDVVAQGPLLLGAGLGYKKHLGSAVAFLAQLDAMAGIAVASKLGSAIELNTGVSADVSIGFAVGF
ncbi:MAG TPA: tetratricopeptide repeat protein [Kofleriaceae bacterium]|jgi:hypothetical protein|nr:tetratricopeptide repeat protein [Kofleriaceae bacterium]